MTIANAAVMALLLLALLPGAGWGRADPFEAEAFRELAAHSAAGTRHGGRKAAPAAIPDIYGPGAVLNAGNLYMKVTNFGAIGNPFTHLSSDPSGQWPAASGIEYLNFCALAVGGVNTAAAETDAKRRVSYINEWFPPSTSNSADRMYRAYEGIRDGGRFRDDDVDYLPGIRDDNIDEEFLDGHDNDGDGRIDEDFAALGQLMFSCVMRDDTPAALASVGNEKHVPLGLECRQVAWAYSLPGFQDFNLVEYTIYNRSGHTLDSLYIGFRVDMDAGPVSGADFFTEDQDFPTFPSGEYRLSVAVNDPRRLGNQCPTRKVRVNGFSLLDPDGDEGRTPGIATMLLFGHTVDPLGISAPRQVGFRAFRSFVAGTPYQSGGNPSTDQQRYEFMSSVENIDPFVDRLDERDPYSGFIRQGPGQRPADYTSWASVGPFINVPDGGSISATIGIAVHPGTWNELQQWPQDWASYQEGRIDLFDLQSRYPALKNALEAQLAYEGTYVTPPFGYLAKTPTCNGCETGIKLPPGSPPVIVSEVCYPRDVVNKRVTADAFTWFDFDCDSCTGLARLFQRKWDADSPPPSPNLNVASNHGYTDNPNRVVAGGDNQIRLAWDNLSETTADPRTRTYDFRSYKVWKVAGWTRPYGSVGPNDEEWQLLGEFRWFDGADSNFTHYRDATTDTLVCPKVLVPNWVYPAGDPHCREGCRDTATVGICLRRGDLWNRRSGQIIRPDPNVPCLRDTATGGCAQDSVRLPTTNSFVRRTRYPVGRYQLVDTGVKNGFTYFYSVTAGDSTSRGELFGRRTAVEADGVVPQAATRAGKSVWVVPNPYRGFRSVGDRPSSWDLTPSATDPTGTHIDFMGMPPGPWKIRIYTISGDLVEELRHDDPVNQSVRGTVTGPDGVTRPGFNRQQDSPNDGQARWNLISRNGQDIASGIYVFVVESQQGQQRGRFVVVR